MKCSPAVLIVQALVMDVAGFSNISPRVHSVGIKTHSDSTLPITPAHPLPQSPASLWCLGGGGKIRF